MIIPAEVTAREGYNHVGDLTWVAREGGRILLPLECFYPGRPGGATVWHGIDRCCRSQDAPLALLRQLDPAEIPKAMWAEVSPDGAWSGPRRARTCSRTGPVT